MKIRIYTILIALIIVVSGCNNVDKTTELRNIAPTNSQVRNSSPAERMPPNEAIASCKDKAIGDTCQFESKDGVGSNYTI